MYNIYNINNNYSMLATTVTRLWRSKWLVKKYKKLSFCIWFILCSEGNTVKNCMHTRLMWNRSTENI